MVHNGFNEHMAFMLHMNNFHLSQGFWLISFLKFDLKFQLEIFNVQCINDNYRY